MNIIFTNEYVDSQVFEQGLMNRIKDRARRKAALSDRKSALAQARMKNIATLAADDRVPKKKRKAGGGEHFQRLRRLK